VIPVAAVPLEVGADQSGLAQSPEGEMAQTELAEQRQQRWGPLLAVAVSQLEEEEG
tara:strand:+ start:204 stop:371 length:168 start_codon:yes stop_codon:yes gene_type:complete